MNVIWTVGETIEYGPGLIAEVVFVQQAHPNYAVVRKTLEGGAHAYEAAHRERAVDPDDPSDDTWVNPLENEDQFHTVDAAMSALAGRILWDIEAGEG